MNYNEYVKLPRSFYVRPNVVTIARDLLGKFLFTNIDGFITGGKIVETEAYNGRNDKACHAFLKRTERTKVMYKEGGQAYVYLCYGIHHLFNIVTNAEGLADAVLIRGVEPVVGVDVMKERRNFRKGMKLSAGPGTLSQALGIHKIYSGYDLVNGEMMWVGEHQNSLSDPFEIETDARIGIDYAGEDALLPWRFFIKGNDYVSVQKKSRQ